MAQRIIKFSSIKQFRDVIRDIRKIAQYVEYDYENDHPVVDRSAEIPVLTFKGTVKLHGTNGGICYSDDGGLWAQSRNRVLSIDKDNAKFCEFVEITHKKEIMTLIRAVVKECNVDTSLNIVSIYGEWCGGNIQKNVAICGLPLMFIIFGIKITSTKKDDDTTSFVDDTTSFVDGSMILDQKVHVENSSHRFAYESVKIYNIHDFDTFEITIDFATNGVSENSVTACQKKLAELTEQVENECPVGRAFGRVRKDDKNDGKVCTVGEGIVWRTTYKDRDWAFKVKGEKHSVTRVKTLANVDVEKMKSIQDFVEYAATENRFEQGVQVLFTSESREFTIKNTGEFVNWVKGDIFKEEMDTLVENNLKPVDVAKRLNNASSKWYRNYLDSTIF